MPDYLPTRSKKHKMKTRRRVIARRPIRKLSLRPRASHRVANEPKRDRAIARLLANAVRRHYHLDEGDTE
jgi:hypothetical protein